MAQSRWSKLIFVCLVLTLLMVAVGSCGLFMPITPTPTVGETAEFTSVSPVVVDDIQTGTVMEEIQQATATAAAVDTQVAAVMAGMRMATKEAQTTREYVQAQVATAEEEIIDDVEGSDIVDTAVAIGDFTTFVAAVEAAGLVDMLKSEGPFTVFVLGDEVFAALPEELLEYFFADPEGDLRDLLLHHVVSGKVMAADLLSMDGEVIEDVRGGTISVFVDDDKLMLDSALVSSVDGDTFDVGFADVVAVDIDASNGVLHVVDSILIPFGGYGPVGGGAPAPAADEEPGEPIATETETAILRPTATFTPSPILKPTDTNMPQPTSTFEPTETSISTQTPSVDELVRSAVDKLETGTVGFTPPDEMTAGIPRQVLASIIMSVAEPFVAELVQELEEAQDLGEIIPPETKEIRVSSLMEMQLIASDERDFKIVPTEAVKQAVGETGSTQWQWEVTPLRAGRNKVLKLEVFAVAKVVHPDLDEPDEVRKLIPVLREEIDVGVNLPYTARLMVANYGLWLIGTTVAVLSLLATYIRLYRRGSLPFIKPKTFRQQEKLQRVLLRAFTEADLRRVAKFGLGLNLEEIAGGEDLTEVTFNLIMWAEQYGQMDALVMAAYRQNTGNPELRAFTEEYFGGLPALKGVEEKHS